MTKEELARIFDHTFLKAYASRDDFIQLCNEAKSIGAAMVAINSEPVKLCKELLKGTNIHVGAAISFPLGQTTIAVKAFETIEAIKDGADEIDYVLNLAKVKDGDFTYIKEEMETIVKICREAGIISKVIFENCYLTKDEIRKCAQIAKEVKPDFIKTSTGFGTSGALIEDVKIMLETVDGVCKVKAAGGIRDYKTFNEFINLGVERIGTSSTKTIIKEFKENDE